MKLLSFLTFCLVFLLLACHPKLSKTTSTLVRVNADSIYRLGDKCRLIERWDSAMYFYTQAIKIEPKPLYYLDRGAVRVQLGLVEEGKSDMFRVLQFDSTEVRAYANLAIAENVSENWNSAIQYANKAIALNKNWAYPYYIRGESYLFKGDTIQLCNDLTIAARLGMQGALDRILKYCAKEVKQPNLNNQKN